VALQCELLKAEKGDEPIGDTIEIIHTDLKSAAAEALQQLAQHQMQAFRECRANAPMGVRLLENGVEIWRGWTDAKRVHQRT